MKSGLDHVRSVHRLAEYRQRARECRAKAEAAEAPKRRQALLLDADTWERMAEWEEANGAAYDGPRPSLD